MNVTQGVRRVHEQGTGVTATDAGEVQIMTGIQIYGNGANQQN